MESIKVLDGYVRLVEAWGHGDAGKDSTFIDGNEDVQDDNECGVIEAARQSTQGSFRGWNEDEKLLGYLDRNGHNSPFEFSGMIIEMEAPFFVIREAQRHRTLSISDDTFSGDMGYNEMSGRYAPIPCKDYVPSWEDLKRRGEASNESKNTQNKGEHPWNELMAKRWLDRLPSVYEYLEKVYRDALFAGVPKELARIPLPIARYSRMRVTGYLRNWMAFSLLRNHKAAQEEIRKYGEAIDKILEQTFPRTYKLFSQRRNG